MIRAVRSVNRAPVHERLERAPGKARRLVRSVSSILRGAEDLDNHPSRGASFEGFVVDQLLSAYRLRDPACQAWFWRTAQGDEVDLLIETAGRLVPFEVKLHSAPGPDTTRGLRRCMADLRLPRGYVVYPGVERYSLGQGVAALPAASVLGGPRGLARL